LDNLKLLYVSLTWNWQAVINISFRFLFVTSQPLEYPYGVAFTIGFNPVMRNAFDSGISFIGSPSIGAEYVLIA
jgi:hypothetical protein